MILKGSVCVKTLSIDYSVEAVKLRLMWCTFWILAILHHTFLAFLKTIIMSLISAGSVCVKTLSKNVEHWEAVKLRLMWCAFWILAILHHTFLAFLKTIIMSLISALESGMHLIVQYYVILCLLHSLYNDLKLDNVVLCNNWPGQSV